MNAPTFCTCTVHIGVQSKSQPVSCHTCHSSTTSTTPWIAVQWVSHPQNGPPLWSGHGPYQQRASIVQPYKGALLILWLEVLTALWGFLTGLNCLDCHPLPNAVIVGFSSLIPVGNVTRAIQPKVSHRDSSQFPGKHAFQLLFPPKFSQKLWSFELPAECAFCASIFCVSNSFFTNHSCGKHFSQPRLRQLLQQITTECYTCAIKLFSFSNFAHVQFLIHEFQWPVICIIL